MSKQLVHGVSVSKAPAEVSGRLPNAAAGRESNPLFGLQRDLGNQAMLRLLESGLIQPKLRVSQPGDADEAEADRVAARVMSSRSEPVLHRKCSCAGGTKCSECEQEQEGMVHRSVVGPLLRSSEASIQRAPAEQSSTAAGPAQQPPAAAPGAAHPLVVEDDAKSVEPQQMRKSQFVALLRTDACAAADAVLASVGHTTKSCPYIEKWLSFYEKQSSQHIERALRKYAPETATARSAHEAIRLVVLRIQRAAITWAKTGKIEGLPEEIARQVGGQGGFLGAVHSIASSGVGGAILGFIGGTHKKEDSSPGNVSRKARDEAAAPTRDAAAVRAQLGTGHSLDSRVQSQMSSAFGHDFSGVRVHTDSRADRLSSDLQARAFTIGSDVAFASGEYRPGTLVGDALIAHELAHVVQQAGTTAASDLQRKPESEYNSLEQDADRSALGAMMTLWTIGKTISSNFAASAVPRLKSGLALSRCNQGPAAPRAPVAQRPAAPAPTTAGVECPLASPAVKPGVVSVTFESSPDYFKKDDTAKAINTAAKDTSVAVSERAVSAVWSILQHYYPSHVAEVTSVKFDAQEPGLAASRQSVGTLLVGSTFVANVAEPHTFAHEVLRVGHELEHIQQYGLGMGADSKTCEREFCAFTHEALALEVEHTGLIWRPDRVGTIDAAIGYYYCLKPEDQAKYKDTELKKLLDRRQEEMKQIKDPKMHFPSIPPESPPATCVTEPGSKDCRGKAGEKP